MYLVRTLWLLACGALLAGCAIKPPPRLSCNFRSFDVRIDDSATRRAGGLAALDPYTEAVRQSLEAGAARAAILPGRPPGFLSLSGGSLNGAYGAGYLDEWRLRSPSQRLPVFPSVTGISTGAILATFAFTNRTEAAVRGYSIAREDQLLKTFVKPKQGKLGIGAYVKMLRRGALGDLAPLRTRLDDAIDDSVLRDVAAGAADGRSLFVGVVDVDTGEAVAMDLTDMAQRYAAAQNGRPDHWKRCYIEAIVASSSAPMAAAPVYIDNRMYIDGGARFGMFNEGQIRAATLVRGSARASRRQEPDNFLLINGEQRIAQRCGKRNAAACTKDSQTGGDVEPTDWRLTDLALRSESILANQVYRFSEDKVAGNGAIARTTKIERDVDEHPFTIADKPLGPGQHTCGEWKKIDVDFDDPVQFKPRYMHCLINYGRKRASEEGWWRVASQ